MFLAHRGAIGAVVHVLAASLVLGPAAPVHAAAQGGKQVHGAIAYEATSRAVGYAYDFKSSRDAKVAALKQCGDPGCVVLVSFQNACGAVARGPGKPYGATGATRAEAETKALRACANKTCEVAAWACTR